LNQPPEQPRRPLRDRIWFTKPQLHWYGRKTLIPFFWGGDEFDWHVWTFGWSFSGRVSIAIRPCPGTGECLELGTDKYLPVSLWPIDMYGADHSKK